MENAYQKTKILAITSSLSHKRTEDPDFGNRLLYFESKKDLKNPLVIEVKYLITRNEQLVLESGSNSNLKDKTGPASLAAYLLPRGLEATDPSIRKIADEITQNINDPLQKAQAIYQYVLKHMQYDKSGDGWGRGDALYACQVGKGNCTDFHALFISLAKASGIPARFFMGIPLPKDPAGKPSSGYHCWAEFYIAGRGWIPVDASEAWKNKSKSEYFFGNLDPDRIMISEGRGIRLSPKQDGPDLNYLSKPYVEIDGKPFDQYKLERTYKNTNLKSEGKL